MEIFGLAIFASVVLYLAVTHKGFRKVVLWTGAACLLCAMAGGMWLWHRNRAESAAKRATQANDDAIQNARIVRASAYANERLSKEKQDCIGYDPYNDPYKPFGGYTVAGDGTPCRNLAVDYDALAKKYGGATAPLKHGAKTDWFAQNAPHLYGNATLSQYEGDSLFNCDANKMGSDILASVPDETRVKVLAFGYEWGEYGQYGAKIQLANGLTGCILHGDYLKLDGED